MYYVFVCLFYLTTIKVAKGLLAKDKTITSLAHKTNNREEEFLKISESSKNCIKSQGDKQD